MAGTSSVLGLPAHVPPSLASFFLLSCLPPSIFLSFPSLSLPPSFLPFLLSFFLTSFLSLPPFLLLFLPSFLPPFHLFCLGFALSDLELGGTHISHMVVSCPSERDLSFPLLSLHLAPLSSLALDLQLRPGYH